MTSVITCKSTDGRSFQFVDKIIGHGKMKDVYFSPDKSYVICFFRDKLDYQSIDRLEKIVGRYHDGIFQQEGGDYWQNLFCWPFALVEYNGKYGVVAPSYSKNYYFQYGSKNDDFLKIAGKEKQGKWFASPTLRNRHVDERELGSWLTHLQICLSISRATRRLHAAGLAHSDLSYKNVLVDPMTGRATIIDLDGLVVPNVYPPDVVGTPDFIAPEVVRTSHLNKDDPNRYLPKRETDLHALAVLIYMYLLCRHPLDGCKVHDVDDDNNDQNLRMGAKALFIEHPTDKSNRVKKDQVSKWAMPWADTNVLPYTLTGPYLSPLINRAFVDGLHDPSKRPLANEWETALVKTLDLIQPCQNKDCKQKWYVFDNSTSPKCPFCNTPFKGKLPILNLYSSSRNSSFRPDNHRLMVWTGQSLQLWHASSLIAPNEKLKEEEKRRVGYFLFHNNSWWLINEKLGNMFVVESNGNLVPVPIGEKVELTEGKQILLEKGLNGRLVSVQMVER